jgi:3-methyladenine DNA glycosylase Tag
MPSTGIVFDRIDELLERIRKHADEPEFSRVFEEREQPPDYEVADNDVLRTMIELIAFSQGARADRIGAMRERGVFEEVFGSFEPASVARMDPEEIRKKHWTGKLSPMRFPDKINKMVACAESLHQIAKRHASYMRFLKEKGFIQKRTSTCSGMYLSGFVRKRRHFFRTSSACAICFRHFTFHVQNRTRSL